MQLLGATVVPVESGTRTLKDATNEALRDWVTNVPDHALHHRLGRGPRSVPAHGARLPVGHRPRGPRADAGALRRGCRTRWWPASAAARTRWGSSRGFLDDADVRLVGVEAAGEGISSGHHSATLSAGVPGVLHGSLSYLLQDADGQVSPGPLGLGRARLSGRRAGAQLSAGHRPGRPTSRPPTREALDAFQAVSRLEGIIPALETAHAFA